MSDTPAERPSYRTVFRFVQDAIIVADAETGMIVDANAAAEALTGRSLSELRTLNQAQLHPAWESDRAHREFGALATRTLRAGDRQGEWHVARRDGSSIPVDLFGALWTEEGQPPLMIGIFRDASERRRATEAVRRSEERFRQIAEVAGEFIWEVDTEGLYTYASPVVEQILGYTPEEIVGKMHFYDLFVPERREGMKKASFETFQRHEPYRSYLNLNVRKDGSVAALETSGVAFYDPSGAFLGYRGTDRDVTERREAEIALRKSEQQLVSIYNTVQDAIFHVAIEPEGEFRFVSVNAAFLRRTGLSREAVVGKTVNEVLPERYLNVVLERCREAVEERIIVSWEERGDLAGGGLTGEVSIAPVLDNTGRSTHLVGSVHSLAERKAVDSR